MQKAILDDREYNLVMVVALCRCAQPASTKASGCDRRLIWIAEKQSHAREV